MCDVMLCYVMFVDSRYSEKIRRLNVLDVEFSISLRRNPNDVASRAMRFICSNPTGYVLTVDTYDEKRDLKSGSVCLCVCVCVSDAYHIISYHIILLLLLL